MPSEALRAKMATAKLVHKAVHADGRLCVIKIRPDTGERWWYRAGQYTSLGLDTPEHGFVVRAYSIAGSPLDPDLEFYIALVENGKLTPTIFAQELGATFHLLKPVGKFTLAQAHKPIVLMVATGTGLAPFVAMIRTLWKGYHAGLPSSERVILFHGASYADELVYRDELATYASDAGFDFTYITTSSRPDPARGWTSATGVGRVNEVVRHVLGAPLPEGRTVALPAGMDRDHLRGLIDPGQTACMTCGNPGMIDDLKEPVAHIGISTSLTEEFWKA
jgi:ferredoxin/flavodoxin---NADP+ reductase